LLACGGGGGNNKLLRRQGLFDCTTLFRPPKEVSSYYELSPPENVLHYRHDWIAVETNFGARLHIVQVLDKGRDRPARQRWYQASLAPGSVQFVAVSDATGPGIRANTVDLRNRLHSPKPVVSTRRQQAQPPSPAYLDPLYISTVVSRRWSHPTGA
jgi:hypothetical protein